MATDSPAQWVTTPELPWPVVAMDLVADFHYPQPSTGLVYGMGTSRYGVSQWESHSVLIADRTAEQIRKDHRGFHNFLLVMSGSLTSDLGKATAAVGPGTIAPFGIDVPSRTVTTPFKLLHFRVPRSVIDDRANPTGAPLQTVLRADRGLGRIAAGLMFNLYREGAALSADEFDAVGDQISTLMCLLIQGDLSEATAQHLPEIAGRVRRYLDRHAVDPRLSLQRMAVELGHSTRSIQVALQAEGATYRALVQDARLGMAHDRLNSPAHAHMSIADIAEACGFGSSGRLTALYRKRYGKTPRQAKQEAAALRRLSGVSVDLRSVSGHGGKQSGAYANAPAQ